MDIRGFQDEIDLFFNVQGFRDDPTHEKLYRTRFLGHKFVSCGGPE